MPDVERETAQEGESGEQPSMGNGHNDSEALRMRLEDILRVWRERGIPARWTMERTLEGLLAWREESGILGLFRPRPLMCTATLDDGWGHGLEIIHLCAKVSGMEVQPLGLLQSPERIVAACRKRPPHFLGLTMLLSDSEDALRYVAENLPSDVRLIAGGPPFKLDPELASRAGVHHVSAGASDFLEYLLSLPSDLPRDFG